MPRVFGKETGMTGSALAPVIISVVAIAALAAWLAMVFYADAHPSQAGRRTAREPGSVAAVGPRPVPETGARDGEETSGAPEPVPSRRAA